MGEKLSAAYREGRTVFTGMVMLPPTEPTYSKIGVPLHVLKWADANGKIGGWLERGSWFRQHGRMPIFSLTLEERATCPASCPLWRGCYGDNMPFGHRFSAGIDLMGALEIDLSYLSATFPAYATRLHVLGDFFSRHYVEFWSRMLREHEPLHVYGYTHRQPGTDIGDAVTVLVGEHGGRCSILRSDPTTTGDPLPAAVVVPHDTLVPPAGFVICPNEQGKTKSCGTCGLCMNGRTNIAFLDHSSAVVRKRRKLA